MKSHRSIQPLEQPMACLQPCQRACNLMRAMDRFGAHRTWLWPTRPTRCGRTSRTEQARLGPSSSKSWKTWMVTACRTSYLVITTPPTTQSEHLVSKRTWTMTVMVTTIQLKPIQDSILMATTRVPTHATQIPTMTVFVTVQERFLAFVLQVLT